MLGIVWQDNESDLLGRMDQLSREREEVTGREEIDKLAKQLRHVPIDKLTKQLRHVPIDKLTKQLRHVPIDKLANQLRHVPIDKLAKQLRQLPYRYTVTKLKPARLFIKHPPPPTSK